MSRDLVGFRALGRQGELGVVVATGDEAVDRGPELVIRGGVSSALVYYVPPARVYAISPEHGTVVLDVDVTDFVPTLHDDGTIELRVPSG